MDRQRSAVVFSMFETGLGIARSLGRQGVPVYGIDFKKDAGYYSRYLKPVLLPHPLEREVEFIDSLIELAEPLEHKPVLFISSDDYLVAVSRNRARLARQYLFNLSPHETVMAIMDKYHQHRLMEEFGVSVPMTLCIRSGMDIANLPDALPYPLFVKGLDVNLWRRHVGVKGYLLQDATSLKSRLMELVGAGIPCVVQEVIPGDDTRHYKFSGYVSRQGELLLGFTSQKLRQWPAHFGVGSVMQGVQYPELMTLGRTIFENLGYRGVGSIEFKLDERDGKLKFIELNQRYWQQNVLATVCGMNFPMTDYMEMTDQHPSRQFHFRTDIKWVNWYLDICSFRQYRSEGCLDYYRWLTSLGGKKVDANLCWDDMLPGLYHLYRMGPVSMARKVRRICSDIERKHHGSRRPTAGGARPGSGP